MLTANDLCWDWSWGWGLFLSADDWGEADPEAEGWCWVPMAEVEADPMLRLILRLRTDLECWWLRLRLRLWLMLRLRLKVVAVADSKSVIPVLAELVHFPSYFHRFPLYAQTDRCSLHKWAIFLPQISANRRRWHNTRDTLCEHSVHNTFMVTEILYCYLWHYQCMLTHSFL
jgi:hypothetical protein